MQRTKTYPNQRLQLNDYEAVAKLVLENLLRENRIFLLPDARDNNERGTEARVLSGFDLDNISGGTAILHRGTGVFPYWANGTRQFGILIGEEEPENYSLDFSLEPNDTYIVYVRLVDNSTDLENRIFWDPGAAGEYVDNVATRTTPSWQYVFQPISVAPPGNDEWVPLWAVGVNGGNISSANPYHPMYFEGQAWAAGYEHEWGDGANDRNANRRLYGAHDMHTFVQLVRRQIADIIGAQHFSAIPLSLTAMDVEHQASGAHDLITANRVDARSGTPGLVAGKILQAWPNAGDPNGFSLVAGSADLACKLLDMDIKADLASTKFLTQSRSGILGVPNIFYEPMLYAAANDIDTAVPGNKWGRYYTAATSPTISMLHVEHDDAWAGGMNTKIVTTAVASQFAGIRTGATGNGHANAGWYMLSRRPKCLVAVRAAVWANCIVDLGFWNDLSPLDSDPSRAIINVGTTGAGGIMYGTDSTFVAGSTNLIPGGPTDDVLYFFVLEVLANNKFRVTCLNNGNTETITKSTGAAMIEASGGNPVAYSFFCIATPQAAASETVYIKRFLLLDEAHIGPA
jgi:hypothetical protein